MPDLATIADVSARLGHAPTAEENGRIPGLLEEATTAVIAFLGCTPDPVPDAVRIAVARMVARALTTDNPVGVTQDGQTMGPFSYTRRYGTDASSGGVWLTRQDKNMLRRHGCRGRAANVATA